MTSSTSRCEAFPNAEQQFSPNAEHKPQLRLWLKFQYGKGRTEDGTAILKNYLKANGSDRERIKNKLIRLAQKYQAKDLIWQARIYEHPGNHLHWSWKQEGNNSSPNITP